MGDRTNLDLDRPRSIGEMLTGALSLYRRFPILFLAFAWPRRPRLRHSRHLPARDLADRRAGGGARTHDEGRNLSRLGDREPAGPRQLVRREPTAWLVRRSEFALGHALLVS